MPFGEVLAGRTGKHIEIMLAGFALFAVASKYSSRRSVDPVRMRVSPLELTSRNNVGIFIESHARSAWSFYDGAFLLFGVVNRKLRLDAGDVVRAGSLTDNSPLS